MIIVYIAIVLIIMYYCCTKCRHTRTIFKYCFPFLPISCIVCTSRCTELIVEVTNVTKGNGIWAHFVSTGYFSTQIQLSRPIQTLNMTNKYVKKMMYILKLFVVYLNGLESIGQILILWGYLGLQLICQTWHMFLYLWTMM